MNFFQLFGEGLRAIGEGIGSIFGPSRPVYHTETKPADWGHFSSTMTTNTLRGQVGGKDIKDITVTENGVRRHVRMEDGKVVASENVSDPEAFVKLHTERSDREFENTTKTFEDMSANMDKTFRDMDANFKKMFKDQ